MHHAHTDACAAATASPISSTPSKPPGALGGRCRAVAKTGDGSMEAMRALLVAKRSGLQARVRSLNQIRHLTFTAPDELRARLQHIPAGQLAVTTARL